MLGPVDAPRGTVEKLNFSQLPNATRSLTRSGSATPQRVPATATRDPNVWLATAPSLAGLTTLQLTVARLVAVGHADKVIAARIGRSEDTVAYHIRRIADQLALDRTRNLRVLIAQRVFRAAEHHAREVRASELRKRVTAP